MGRRSRIAAAGCLVALATPDVAAAKVQVLPDPNARNHPHAYWVIRRETADDYQRHPQLLRAKMPELAYDAPLQRPARLGDGEYYIIPVCNGIGIWLDGRVQVSDGDPPVRLKCP